MNNNNENIFNDNVLLDINNYKEHIDYNVNEMIKIYNNLIYSYLEIIQDKMQTFNSKLKKYIFNSGIEVINNVYPIILLYTKNSNLTHIITQNSLNYFIEFIDEIIKNNTTNIIKLSIKDSILFVYKKSINKVPLDIKKNFSNTKEEEIIHNILLKYINIINTLIQSFYTDVLDNNNKINISNEIEILKNNYIIFSNKICECILFFENNDIIINLFDIIYNIQSCYSNYYINNLQQNLFLTNNNNNNNNNNINFYLKQIELIIKLIKLYINQCKKYKNFKIFSELLENNKNKTKSVTFENYVLNKNFNYNEIITYLL